MVEHRKYIVILFCIIGFLACAISNSESNTDPYPNIIIPILKSGYDVKEFIDKSKSIKSVNYFVESEYPATEVLKFYDEQLKKTGWVRSSRNGFGGKKWECFFDGTIKGDPQVRQLLALWVNKSLKIEAFLALRYLKLEKDWGNELHVQCQVQPLIDKSKLENFLKQLKKTKQYSNFMTLLDSYRISNGEVNIDKAISEHPENTYLKEYKKIVEEVSLKR
ncbi:hypothetical protein ACFL03_06705 [Thermodesulfobacteriota bacterium]